MSTQQEVTGSGERNA